MIIKNLIIRHSPRVALFSITKSRKRAVYSLPVAISSQSQQLSEVINLQIKPKATSLIVIRNYLIPTRPSTYRSLIQYFSSVENKNEIFTQKELQIKLKGMTDKDISKLNKTRLIQNEKVQILQAEYDRVFRAIKILPDYHHMLLAKAQSNIDGNQNENLQKAFDQKQLFQKLTRIHPFIRIKAYQKYEQIHNQYATSKKNYQFAKKAHRLPILAVIHPYQLYMADKYLQEGRQLPFSQHYMSDEVAANYDRKFQKLDENMKGKYQRKINGLLLDYAARIEEISRKNGGISESQIEILKRGQFNSQNQSILKRITVK